MRNHLLIKQLILAALAGSLCCCSTPKSVSKPNDTDNNKKVVLSYFNEVVNKRRLDLVKEIFSPQYVFYGRDGSVDYPLKNNALVPFLKHLFKAFPDLRYKINDVIAEGATVAISTSAKGSHQSEFLGIEGSGNKVDFKEMFFFRLADGKIVEGTNVVDIDRVKEQLKRK